jgi:radical SAM superfamily enzyme YgiQ (UPF0313 family)
MNKKVLIIDVLSTLRVEKGLICPLPAAAQISGIIEKMGIPFDVVFAIAQEDGSVDTIKDNRIIPGIFENTLKDISPDIVLFFSDAELVKLVSDVHTKTMAALPDAVFCISSIIANALPDLYLEAGFDYILGQDVFMSLTELLTKINTDTPPEKGIISIPDKKETLDHLPFVSKIFFEKLKPQWTLANGDILYYGIIFGSLGCTGACSHCPNSNYWGTVWKPMSAERIVAEIEYQKEFLNTSLFYMGDINFCPNKNNAIKELTVHPKAIERIIQLDTLLKEKNINAQFITTIRPDTISHLAETAPDILQKLLKMFKFVFLGFESFNSSVISGLSKNITKDMIRKAASVLEENNIPIIASFLVGSKYETRETLTETENFIMEELPPSTIPLLNIMTPFPGTKLFNELKQSGEIIEKDINLYNAQNLVFKHPIFTHDELKDRIQSFYMRFFTERFTG